MINSCRQTVLAILNKNNYGVITPSDFNQFALQSQLEIFENFFSKYNQQIFLENARRSGTDYADLSKDIAEAIEVFSVTNFLTHSSDNMFYLPSLSTTGDTYFMIGKILCYTTTLASGDTSSIVVNRLVDSVATFTSDVISANDIVINTSTNEVARVVSVLSATAISLTDNIFTYAPDDYVIVSASQVKEAEKVTHGKITMLNTSLLTTPNNTFPAYTLSGNLCTVYPSTINSIGKVQAQYFRYPLAPKWTYVTLSGGEPIFDQSAADY